VDGEFVAAGDISDEMLSDNVALRNEANIFTVLQAFNDGVTIGTFSPRADFHVVGATWIEGIGMSTYYPALLVTNRNANGIGIFSKTISSDANLVIANKGSGELIKGFSGANGNNLVFMVENDGTTGIGTSNPTEKLHVVGNTKIVGSGTTVHHPGLHVSNTNSSGIAIFSTVTSSDANLVVVNKGDGKLIKAFSGSNGGNLVFQVDNDGNLHCDSEASCASLEIRGGADLSEPFAMSDDLAEPGSVVVIDEDHPGRLKLSTQAYDTKVAGIISGAGGVKPGIRMTQEDALEGGQNVALSGRVYAWVDASEGAVNPGDLLTTSDTPGHAMKASDRSKVHGAILGKAMSRLEQGRGLVLVLVSLQ
jgi:hypothetical protein